MKRVDFIALILFIEIAVILYNFIRLWFWNHNDIEMLTNSNNI